MFTRFSFFFICFCIKEVIYIDILNKVTIKRFLQKLHLVIWSLFKDIIFFLSEFEINRWHHGSQIHWTSFRLLLLCEISVHMIVINAFLVSNYHTVFLIFRNVDGEIRVGVFAARAIEVGEPLTYDYRYDTCFLVIVLGSSFNTTSLAHVIECYKTKTIYWLKKSAIRVDKMCSRSPTHFNVYKWRGLTLYLTCPFF